MNLFGKPIDLVNEEDLHALVRTTIEKTILDVKRDGYSLDHSNPEVLENKVKELCKDVASFANYRGGIIICGVTEKNGVISEVTGIDEPSFNIEKRVKRIEQIVRSEIEPILFGFRALPIALNSGKFVILLSIPRSVNAPHRIKRDKRFVIRRSVESPDMDIHELRQAFLNASSYLESIQKFRTERVEAIVWEQYHQMPVHVSGISKLIMHCFPLGFNDLPQAVDLSLLTSRNIDSSVRDKLDPSRKVSANGFANFNGFLAPYGAVDREHSTTFGYAQYYRNGIIEYVRSLDLSPNQSREPLALSNLERMFVEGVWFCLNALEGLSVSPPIVLSIDMGIVQSKVLRDDRASNQEYEARIPYKLLSFEPVTFEQYPDSLLKRALHMRATLTQLANLAGRTTSALFAGDEPTDILREMVLNIENASD